MCAILEDCIWKTYDYNFDHVGHGLVTLFIVGTAEGWPDIMYASIDGDDASVGPSKD